MMPVVPNVKRPNGFSIDSLMGKDVPTSSPSEALTRDILSGSSFHPVSGTGASSFLSMKHLYEQAAMSEAGLSLGHLGMASHPALAGAALHAHAAAAAGLPGHTAPPLHPMLLGAQRDPFPFYPWLMSRHGGYLTHRFAGPDTGLLLQPFRKPKRIRTAFSPSQLLRLEHAFEKNHYVVGQERKELAASLSLSETQVKVWFQNRRTKYKRMKAEEGENPGSSPGRDEEHSEDEEDDLLEKEEEEDSEDECPSSPKKQKTAHHLNKWKQDTNQV